MSFKLENGWNISENGYSLITENQTINNRSQILKNALNADLKEIGSPIIQNLSKNASSEVVLQIQKIRNVSAPKSNEKSQGAPRMLKLVLTDGHEYIQAVELAPIAALSVDATPPGTKILVKAVKISLGYLLLDSANCSCLGGQVPAMYEKWQIAKSVQLQTRNASAADGPPVWVNFGVKIHTASEDKQFKSLAASEVKENTKFDMARQDAIAEAASGAVKKVFGGGSRPVQPAQQQRNTRKPPERRNQKNRREELEEKPQKPSEKVSLFAFLEDKLPVELETSKPQYNVYQKKPQFEQYAPKFNKPQPNNHYQKKPIFEHFNPKPVANENRQNLEMNGLSNNFGNMSINSQFATKSLRQHLNLAPQKRAEENGRAEWKVGDECMAKYWEDKKFYNAVITATTDKTCVVRFKGYDNIEEVLKNDCYGVSQKSKGFPNEYNTRNTRTFKRQ